MAALAQQWHEQAAAFVVMYLAAIVGANLLVARLGPSVSVLTAFLFIGLDLTARDRLHDAWHGERLVWKMATLIVGGSLLTILLNWGAWRIAVASWAAFAVAASLDTVVYHRLGRYPRWLRVNGSNVPGAASDSLVFPVLAFGWPPLWRVMLGQFAAKTLGGALWSVVLSLRRKRK